ncbi:uncharacterized protein L969DRAFT_87208 [Mixia osmundae IAM 14324]|uniref:NAD(P)-binding protein n=1 Tax=Mixia osmundae (strain CBS 9802 / IAM 14324 / JCM 22182 / KY 12970) TaxID=764103 RepID=G7DZR6_MIXOS|nr:uncharacterized protein L969DRAFT_87208 [Mixia osmundae IAM 14324]KEI39265.1 hypothetical protein L969DRAFT_87208 [Mixia osmundae IAM 14324]GAA96076.1 hypothetical protein E5Q_02737 [Mixia osmundae IAM 14324]
MSQATLARIQKIQSHLQTAPQGIRLKDKVCILTGVGSERGIGRASALLFAHEGAKHLYLLDYEAEHLPKTKAYIEKTYPHVKVTTIEADASDEDVISSLCQRAVEENGRLDVFFANAGVATANVLPNIDFDEFENTLKINTISCFLALKHGSAAMQDIREGSGKTESGGSIIMTASVAGIRSGAGSCDYSASKAAVISLAKTGANQLAGTNIRVTAVCPGLISTGMTAMVFDAAKERGTLAKVGQLNPLRRYGVAEEIASAVLFLASDESSYVNGIELPVDGGLSSSHPVVPGKLA